MGRSKSVFNKRSQDRVTSSVKTQPTKHVTQSAHAQPAPNPTTNTSVQSQAQQDPWDRASQFAQNVGRGASDTARAYTTDLADGLTGNYQERKMKDQTLSDVFITGAMEGRLDDSWGEIGRRVTQEPGRVVGEAAVEAGFLIGTMGVSAAGKGLLVGKTAVQMNRAASKAKGIVGYEREIGIIKKGKEIKFIGDKTTETQKWSHKKGWSTKINKTKWTDRIERRTIPMGRRVFGNTKTASSMIHGASGGTRYLDDLKVRGEFTSTKKSLGESFQVGADPSVDPRYFDDAPVEQVINQGKEFSFGGRFPGVTPEMSSISRVASFAEKDGSITTAKTLQELDVLKSRLTKSDIEKITYERPEGRINASSKELITAETADMIENNDAFIRSGQGVLDTSPNIVFQSVDTATLKASQEGKKTAEVENIRNLYLNFHKQEAGRNTELSSPVLNIKQGVKVSDKDEIVSDTAEGVFFNTKKDPLEDTHRLGSLEGDVGISSVGQITSKTGRFQNVGFRATASETKGGTQEVIQNAYNPNAGSKLPYDLTVKPTSPYFTFSGTPDGVKPILRNIPGSSGSAPIDVDQRFAKMFLETNTPGQDFRRLNIGATGSPKRTEFVNVLLSQIIKKNNADPNNPQTTKVYKQVAETMAEKSYNTSIGDWLKMTTKEDAINIKLRNEPGIPYDAESLITGKTGPQKDIFRVRNAIASTKKGYLRKSMKGKGETRLDTGDPLGGINNPKTPYELYVKSKIRKELGITKSEDDWIKRQANVGYRMGGKKIGIPEPVRQPGNTNQNNPWFMGVSQAESKAMLKANIKANKEALAKAPKAKRRRRSTRDAPADTFQFPPQFFNIKGKFNNLDNDFSY